MRFLRSQATVVHRIEPLADPRWNTLLELHPAASIFHTKAWLEALRRTYGYDPIAYTMSPPDAPLESAILFCRIDSWLTGRRLVSLPFSDHCDYLMDGATDLTAFFVALDRILHGEKVQYAELRPRLDAEDLPTTLSRSCYNYCFHELNLAPDLDTLFNQLHKDSVQRKIRRAEKERLTCEDIYSESLLDSFWRLFLMTRRRHQAPPPPKRWIRNVMDCFGEAAKLRIAFKGTQPVAAILTLRFKDTLVYKYGCSDAHFNNLGGMPFLFWRAIQEAKRDGLNLFDLGRSDCDNTGLIVFKDRWGAARSTLTYSRFACSPLSKGMYRPGTSEWKARLARSIVSRLPAGMFGGVGSLLYKHMA
jgi:hypothetical protein